MAEATGGIITTDGAYTVHKFTSSGTFTPNSGNSGSVEVLVVGGGGVASGYVGGTVYAGGGGGGEVVVNTSYSVVGGVGVTVTIGGSATNSVFGTITALKGSDGYSPGHGGNSGDGHLGSAKGAGTIPGAGGGDGGDASGTTAGPGTMNAYSGTNTEYGKGGAGRNTGGTVAGAANTGEGGAGGDNGGLGGSGIVIVRYLTGSLLPQSSGSPIFFDNTAIA